jgi:undecaprenyl-diphosphatase
MTMPALHILILAVVQGLTEFLPVSSDGHLVVAEALLGAKDPASELTLHVILHAGTLLAVLVVYRRHIGRLLGADTSLIGKLIVGTIPAAVVGLALDRYLNDWVTDPVLTGVMLIANGLMLLWGARRRLGEIPYQKVSYAQALWIGLAQAAAPLPGLSRSGTTIVAGLALGLRRDAAATFSFLLAIPVIGGAVLLKTYDLVKASGMGIGSGPLLLGVLVAFAVGWLALRWLLRWLEQGRLQYFAWWCIPLGAAMLVWKLLESSL